MKLIVGLGNPGQRYERTRHNLGFLVIDRLAAQHRVALAEGICRSVVGEGFCGENRIVLAKPQTFMNLSGEAVECLARECSAQDVIVICDDLDLPFGRIRIRARGGAGGHRGVLSIIERLGGAPFYRVRVGIGRPQPEVDPVEYVLQPFSAEESEQLQSIVERAAESVISLLRDGPARAMACFNQAS
jgi:PTH1 family peptidyl-tRNA hydrolase